MPGMPGPTELLVVAALVVGLLLAYIVPCWKILARMGFSPWLSLLVFISPLNIVLAYYVAFSEWPGRQQARVPD